MALYMWCCDKCLTFRRKLLPTRPVLGQCDSVVIGTGVCTGKLRFVTTATSSTKEVIDNGLMYKPVERDPNIEAQLRERNEIAERGEDVLV